MKTLAVIIALLFFSPQTFYGQAKQAKEMLLQIAALKIYAQYAQKGYLAFKKGLNFIGDVKKGEVNLHGDYFTSLYKINPKVKKYAKVAEIISLQVQIIKMSKKTIGLVSSNDLFHGNEIDYIQRSIERLFDNCSNTIDALLIITTDDSIEMKDDQRMERIDLLYEVMLDDFNFCRNFCNDAKVLAISKAKEKNDRKSLSVLYGT